MTAHEPPPDPAPHDPAPHDADRRDSDRRNPNRRDSNRHGLNRRDPAMSERRTHERRRRDPAAPRRSAVGGRTPVQRLVGALRPRASRGQVLGALLCAVLGFALVVQVRQTQGAELDSLRESDLIRILDDVSERTDRLESEAARLSATREELLTSSNAAQAAQEAAQERVDVLAILAGTAPATGPGVRLTISDADARLGAAVLLDAVQELRDAGAEAISVDDVRVVASTAFVDTAEGIEVDGQLVESPYVFLAIGDPQTISTALDIPGGVLRTVRQREGTASAEELDEVVIDALRVPSEPEYARPADPQGTAP